MIEKVYIVVLNDQLLGTTKLEFGDPPMGVVFGQINFETKNIDYDFFKQYCIDNLTEIQTDSPKNELIVTGHLNKLKVYNSKNIEIIGIGNNIEGMNFDGYTITLYGIDSKIYEKEFPEHIITYEQKLKLLNEI